MLSTSPIQFEGREIVPIQFLKALLPDPASLGPRTVGKTNIGCIYTGLKDGKERTIYIYNVCDHQECYKELGSQAISYTTGVPAMIGAALVGQRPVAQARRLQPGGDGPRSFHGDAEPVRPALGGDEHPAHRRGKPGWKTCTVPRPGLRTPVYVVGRGRADP